MGGLFVPFCNENCWLLVDPSHLSSHQLNIQLSIQSIHASTHPTIHPSIYSANRSTFYFLLLHLNSILHTNCIQCIVIFIVCHFWCFIIQETSEGHLQVNLTKIQMIFFCGAPGFIVDVSPPSTITFFQAVSSSSISLTLWGNSVHEQFLVCISTVDLIT